MNLVSHVVAVILAVSYIALGVASNGLARDLWMPYAALTLVFASANIFMERRHARTRR